MIDEVILEQRLAALERAVADIEGRLAPVPPSANWLANLTGSVSDEAALLEALEFGKATRQADRRPDEVGESP